MKWFFLYLLWMSEKTQQGRRGREGEKEKENWQCMGKKLPLTFCVHILCIVSVILMHVVWPVFNWVKPSFFSLCSSSTPASTCCCIMQHSYDFPTPSFQMTKTPSSNHWLWTTASERRCREDTGKWKVSLQWNAREHFILNWCRKSTGCSNFNKSSRSGSKWGSILKCGQLEYQSVEHNPLPT